MTLPHGPGRGRLRGAPRKVAAAGTDARRRVAAGLWPMLQQTAALTASWMIATHFVSHHQPFFAPIATVVGLNASRGERGSNAVRLLVGVVVGILSGEVALALLGRGAVALIVSTSVAMVLSLALSGERILLAQAAASAILVVAAGSQESGTNRLVDALIGAGVALFVSQVLFPAEPIVLLRRAEAAALGDIARAVRLTAEALARDDERIGAQAVVQLASAHTRLADVSRIRSISRHSARRTALWWWRAEAIAREAEHAGELGLLNNSCLMLIRTALDTGTGRRAALGVAVAGIADALAGLADAPGDHRTRLRTAEQVHAAVRGLAGPEKSVDAELRTWLVADAAVHLAATDIMRYVGVPAERIGKAPFRSGADVPDVPLPPGVPRWFPWRK